MAKALVTTAELGQRFDVGTNNAGVLEVSVAEVPDGTGAGLPVNVAKSTAAVGTSPAAARSDHKHDIDTTGTPTASTPGQASLEGGSTALARADHQHALEAFAVPVSVALTNFQGNAETLARSDHVHAIASGLAIAAAYAAAWAVPHWYLDGVIGSDTNDGTTAGTPLRSGTELRKRLGPYALWGQSVTIEVLANGVADGIFVDGCLLVAGSHFFLIGVPTVVGTGTVATYAALNHASNPPTATQLTATGVANWTANQWQRIRTTTGAKIDTIAWVAKADPAGVGVATARISVPHYLDAASTSTIVKATTLVAGDAIAIETLPVVPFVKLTVDGPLKRQFGPSIPDCQLTVSSISTPHIEISSPGLSVANRVLIFGCELGNIQSDFYQISGNGGVNIGACLFGYQDPSIFTAAYLFPQGSWIGCLVGKSVLRISCTVDCNWYATLTQGVRVVQEQRSFLNFSSVQIFDAPTTGGLFLGGSAQMSSVSGTATGYGISVANSSQIIMTGTINLQGTITNARLGNAPTVDLTVAQLMQPSDYAQKGVTAAMVAGTVTVTVPWYDNTVQRVVACHGTLGGTPGALSVQQISSTQFTVTSSSNTDTSTVVWQISALGRNIFISTF